MRQPPQLYRIPHYPVTGGTCLLGLAVSLAVWTKFINVDLLTENYRIWHGQPWRLLTSTLPHVNLIHLAFNLYWIWALGSIIEEVLGSAFVAMLMIVVAAGSSAAEYAFDRGGEGLSGVGYGLFGFLWVVGRYDARFKDVIDVKTIQLFVGWFFLCIVATVMNIMPVGNIAHGSGAVLGAIVGYAVATDGARRIITAMSLAAVVALLLICSSVLRPKVNLSRYGGWDVGQAGYDSLVAGNYEQAVRYFTEATSYRIVDPSSWFDLGLAQERLDRKADAANSYRHALALDPNSEDYKQALKSITR
ncbi:MAG TPA: rhomboid family intramembrane serine protease [Tepidisphaeraceae bacterium]|jgi:GlpG protein